MNPIRQRSLIVPTVASALLLGACTSPTPAKNTRSLTDPEEASYYVCPGGEDDDPDLGNGLGCEIEQYVDDFDNPQPQFFYYPSATTDPGGGIYISPNYLLASTSSDQPTLDQCCANAEYLAGGGLATHPPLRPAAAKLAAAPTAVCEDFRKATGTQADRVDGVKQWELQTLYVVNKCAGQNGQFYAMRPRTKPVVQQNESAVKVTNAFTHAMLIAMIRLGGLDDPPGSGMPRRYSLWLSSPNDRINNPTQINFGSARETAPLDKNFCIVWKPMPGAKTQQAIRTKDICGRGHPTIAAFLNAGAKSRGAKAKGGFWACDGGEGRESPANRTKINQCSGRWPPDNLNVVMDAMAKMNNISAGLWDSSEWLNPCP